MLSLSMVVVACSAPEPETPLSDSGGLRFASVEDVNPANIAARVGKTVITVEDVRRAAADFSGNGADIEPGDDVFRDTLSALIDQRLLGLEASARGIDEEPATRQRLAAAQERILGAVLAERVMSRAVTEETVSAVYDAQSRLLPLTEEIRARHILVSTREEADEVARLLTEGEDFGALARSVSSDISTRFNGGDLGYLTRSGMVPGFAQIAFDIPEQRISAPFETEYGWHVLEVVDRRWQSHESLEDMRPNIVRFLTLKSIDDLLKALRARYPVTRVMEEHSSPSLPTASSAFENVQPAAEELGDR